MKPLTKARVLSRANFALLIVLYPLLIVAMVLDYLSLALTYLPRLVVQNIRRIETEYLAAMLKELGARVVTTPEELERAIVEMTGDEKKDLN